MQLNHYLNFQGQAEQAFNFYKSFFGGEFAMLSRYSDMPPNEGVTLSEAEKNLVLHVSLPINEYTVLMASDTIDQFCTPNSVFTKGNNHYIAINLEKDEQEKAKQLFDALSLNGQVEMPLEKTFWGALYGAFTDQFGIKWMVNCQLDT